MGHKGKALISGIRAHIIEALESSLDLHQVRTRREADSLKTQTRTTLELSLAGTDFRLPSSRTLRNKFLLFISNAGYGTLL